MTESPPRQTVSIELPFPPSELSANNRARHAHWSERSGPSRVYREACRAYAVDARNRASGLAWPFTPPVRMHLTFVLDSRRRRDWESLITAFKPGLDGLVDANLIPDDNVWALLPTYDVELGTRPGVRVRLEAAS